MTQGVGRYGFAHSGSFGRVAHDRKNHLASQVCAAAVQEQIILLAGFYGVAALFALSQIKQSLLNSIGTHGYHALLAALTCDGEESIVERHPAPLKRAQFAHTQARAVEQLKHRTVAPPGGLGQVHGIHHGINFINSQHLGQMASNHGCVQQLRGVCCHDTLKQQKSVERPHPGQHTRLRARSYSGFVECRQESRQVGRRGIVRLHAELNEPRGHSVHIHQIINARVLRQTALQQQVSLVVAAENIVGGTVGKCHHNVPISTPWAMRSSSASFLSVSGL